MIPELHLPWLELTILIPLLGSIALIFIRDPVRSRSVATLLCGVTLLTSVGEWLDFSPLHSFEAHDHWDLFQLFFHRYIFVVDELSAPLLPLTALIYLMTVVSTLRTKVQRFSFTMTLFSLAVVMATLSCKEPWIIVALMSLSTVPPWLEMKARGQCTRVYSIHMGLFVVMLIAGLAIVRSDASPENPSVVAGAMLTFAALLRSGIVPVHCWMTDLFEKATFGTALLFVTPMTGAYVIMRLVLPIAPDWALQSIAVVSLITAVYAAGMALVQKDSRRFFCYLFLSHSSLVLVGLEIVTPIGFAGALCVWASASLSLAGFGLTLRSVESRTGRLSMADFHGFFDQMPTLAALFLLTGLASIGFPGTVGFVGTELLVEGAVEVFPLVGMAVVVAAALNGIAILHSWFRIFTGIRRPASLLLVARPAERFAVFVIAALIVGGGLYPQPGVASRYHAAMALLEKRRVGVSSASEASGQQPEQQPHEHAHTHPHDQANATDAVDSSEQQ